MGASTADGSSNHCQWGQGGEPSGGAIFGLLLFGARKCAGGDTRPRQRTSPSLAPPSPHTRESSVDLAGLSSVSQSSSQSVSQSVSAGRRPIAADTAAATLINEQYS